MTVRRPRDRMWIVRALVQTAFLLYVLYVAVHNALSVTESGSLHALCPFGAVESLWSLVTSGRFVQKIHASSVVLSLGLLAGALVVGGAFCGWICPLGTLGDAMSWVRRKLHIKEVVPAPKVDRILRYARFLVLAGIIYATVSTATLWFEGFDPYYTIFHLGWIFEPDPATQWPAWLISIAVIGGSLFIRRLWCRYLCPLGILLSLVQRISPLKVRRDAAVCINCKRCDRVCPLSLDVSTVGAVSHDCSMCLRCVVDCPAPGALEVALPRTAPLPTQGNRLVRRLLVPLVAVGLLLGSVPVGAALGYWQTTGQVISTLEGATTDDIKGSSTLSQVSAAFDIPLDELISLLGLPADVAPDTKLKDLESYNEVSAVRTMVATWVAEH